MRYLPIRVTAHLAHGFAVAQPWGIALDGLLASQLWDDLVAQQIDLPYPSETADPPDLDLPLGKCQPRDGASWHWSATCCEPVGPHRTEVRYRHHQLDHSAVAVLADHELPAAMPGDQGRYRSRRMPLIVTVCTAVTWSAVGDPAEVRRLLRPIASIGKKRSHGEGIVTSWEVTVDDRDPWEAGHLHRNGALGRPSPGGCLPDHLQETTPALAGIRPPYMHRSRRAYLHLPAPLDAH